MKKELLYFGIGIFFFLIGLVTLTWPFENDFLSPLLATIFCVAGALFYGRAGDLFNKRINIKNLKKNGWDTDNPKEVPSTEAKAIKCFQIYRYLGSPPVYFRGSKALMEIIYVDENFNIIELQ